MTEQQPIIDNKVARSGMITLDLQDWYSPEEIVAFDLKNYLHMELILREKEFRQALEQHDWSQYAGKVLAVYCSADAIIASWAFMLVAAHARGHASDLIYGNPEDAAIERFRQNLNAEDWSKYAGKRVLLRGCADIEVPPSAYLYATQKLLPYTERLMYGEACSFVPVWRASKKRTVPE